MRCKELATLAGLLVISGCDGSSAPTTPGAGANAPPTVSNDGRGGTTTARATAMVRSLSGAWTPLINGVRQDAAELTQEGSTLAGAVDDLTFTGTVSAGLDRIETTGPNFNVPQTRFEFVRP
jgi:hypothetical protein